MSPDDTAPTGGGDRIGTVLAGRYRILSLLGEGAMGAVYLGEHLKIGRRDALKVLRPSLARDEEAIARFTRGARNASGIRHRNVCAIYDFGTTEDGLHFLAMEYVEGGNLTDVLEEEGRLPVERASSILHQAAGALQVAHDRGIIHRDLKPDNIMLARDSGGGDLVKVVDFDISLGPPDGEGARVTRHGYVVGTPEYMSPEQLTGDPLGPASDIYSLALVFFRALTGRLPFDGGTAQEVMVNRLTVDPLTLEAAAPGVGLPPDLEGVLRKALERRAEDRYGSAAEFAQAVGAATGVGSGRGVSDSGAGATARGSQGAAATGAAAGAGSGSADGSTSGSTAGGSIPRTRVSSSGDEAAGHEPEGDHDASGLQRWIVVGGGAVVGLALLVALGLSVLPASRDEPPGAGDGTEISAPAPALDPAGGEPGEVTGDDPGDPPGTGTGSQTPPVDPDPTPPPTRDPPAEVPMESEDPPAATGAPPFPPGPAGIDVSGAQPRELLGRQAGLVLPFDDPGTPVLRAVRDTAYAVWAELSMSRADSALAAYLIGYSMIPVGDSLAGVSWLEKAVELNPLDSYVDFLEVHRRGGGP